MRDLPGQPSKDDTTSLPIGQLSHRTDLLPTSQAIFTNNPSRIFHLLQFRKGLHHEVESRQVQVQHVVEMLMIPSNLHVWMFSNHSIRWNQLQETKFQELKHFQKQNNNRLMNQQVKFKTD